MLVAFTNGIWKTEVKIVLPRCSKYPQTDQNYRKTFITDTSEELTLSLLNALFLPPTPIYLSLSSEIQTLPNAV